MSIELINTANVLQALSHHIGKAKGVKGSELTREIAGATNGRLQRRVRKCIEELRLHGAAICGKPNSGYFMAENLAELKETIAFLIGRTDKTYRQVRALESLTLPDLAGQLHLKM